MPGVPDVYQGTELWDLSLVDPDNRRPVDFSARRDVLTRVAGGPDWPSLIGTWQSGAIKLALLHHLLALRREHSDIFATGDYRPLPARGAHAAHVIAFARSHGKEAIVVAVGRHFAPLTDAGRRWPRAADWQGEIVLDGYAALEPLRPAGTARSGNGLTLSALFDPLPVALLKAKLTR
jgi:(1->4)-alpha-D-glucan 1-alpha-D-glucosylmutase